MLTRDGEGPNWWKLATRQNCLSFDVHLDMAYSSINTFSIEILISTFIGHDLGTIGQSITYSFLLPLTHPLMSSRQNQTMCSTFLMEGNFFYISLYVGVKARHACHFGIAQSPCNGLHCLTTFGRVGWQPYNVPLRMRILNLQHRCGICHTMPCTISRTQCELHSALRGKCSFLWISLQDLCHWPWTSTVGNSFKLQWCWSMAYTDGPTFQPWPIIHNVLEDLDQIIYCAFRMTSQSCPWLLKSLVVDRLCKVVCWHLNML